MGWGGGEGRVGSRKDITTSHSHYYPQKNLLLTSKKRFSEPALPSAAAACRHTPFGGLPYNKNRGCSLEFLKRTPKRNQDLVLWEWLEIVSLLRDTTSKTTISLVIYIFCYMYSTP